jgi:antitoxin ParD1/3/4
MKPANLKSVPLTDEQARFIRERVASGQYHSPGDVVQAGIRLLRQHEAELAMAQRLIKEGVVEADRGELVDGAHLRRGIEQKHERLAAESKRAGS